MNLIEFFEKKNRPKFNLKNSDLVGWFSYGGNNRVKHYYIIDRRYSFTDVTSLCRDGYNIGNLTEKAKKRINKNPAARVQKKCVMCKRRIDKLIKGRE